MAFAGQRLDIRDWNPACDGNTDDSAVLAAAAAAWRDTGAAIYVPPDCRLLLKGAAQVWLRGVSIEGDGARDTGSTPGQQGGTILLQDLSRSPFVVSNDWGLNGLKFYWPNQTPLAKPGSTPVAYPPLVAAHASADTLTNWNFNGNQVINAYDLMDLTGGAQAGGFHVERNLIYTLRYAFILRQVGQESWFNRNQFSVAAWSTIIAAGGGSPTQNWTASHSEAIRIIGNATSTTPSSTAVEALQASENYFLLYNSALHIVGGHADLMTWTSNGLDGLPNPILVDGYGNVEVAVTGGQINQSFPGNPSFNGGCAINLPAGPGGAGPDNGISLAGVDFTGTSTSAICMNDRGNSRLSVTGGSIWNLGLSKTTGNDPAIYFNGPNGTLSVSGVAIRNTVATNSAASIYLQNARAATVTGNTFDGWRSALLSAASKPIAFTGNAISNTQAGGTVVEGSATVSGNSADVPIPQQLSGNLSSADVSGAGTGPIAGAWTSLSVPVAAGTGTLKSATGTLRFKKIGRTVTFVVTVHIADNGTGAANINVTMPWNAASDGAFFGRDFTVGGHPLMALINNANPLLFILHTDNTYPAATGSTLVVNGTYEAAS